MAILNVGSINVDTFYRVPRIPQPGETLAATSHDSSLGGKGLNQSFAIARAGGTVLHAGAVNGQDGDIIATMTNAGIDCRHIARLDDCPTGTALVLVASDGENSIVLSHGANHALKEADIARAVSEMHAGDWLLLQNETNANQSAVALAKAAGMKIALAAAPFVASDILPLIGEVDLLLVNEIEFEQLVSSGAEASLSKDAMALITRGSDGAEMRRRNETIAIPAFRVEPVDTTGAGDTFTGFFLAGIDQKIALPEAMTRASAAAALQVSKHGASVAIPTSAEVDIFLAGHG